MYTIMNKELLDLIKYEPITPKQTGGQSCGIKPTVWKAYSEELGFKLEISSFKSGHENMRLCKEISELILMGIVK